MVPSVSIVGARRFGTDDLALGAQGFGTQGRTREQPSAPHADDQVAAPHADDQVVQRADLLNEFLSRRALPGNDIEMIVRRNDFKLVALC